MNANATIIEIVLSAIFINNFIFSQFLGCCPFLGCSSKIDTAAGMGLAVIFVMGLASAICWIVNEYILVTLHLEFLQTIAYILVIAVLVQFVEMFLKKSVPSLYSALGIYLPLITTNCAVLGVVLLNTQYSFNFLQSVVYGVTGGAGFMLAICLMASVREKIEFADYPESFNGFPIALVTAGLIALAFMGDDDDNLFATSVMRRYPQIFDWLTLIDFNVLFILILMTIVAGFNMISGLLIMLFRNISTIGTLKAMGMTDRSIAKVFLRVASVIVFKGMLAGNLLALALCAVQKWTHVLKLNPENYFVPFVPVHLNLPAVILADAGAYLAIMVLLLIPTLFISHVDPAKTVRAQ